KPMVWRDVGAFEDPDERFDEEHFDAYRAMVALRGGFPALRRGTMRTLVADDARNLWVFERALGDQRVVVALNASAETQEFTLPDAEWQGSDWRTVLDTDGAREVDRLGVVGPLGGRVLVGTKRP
ncbi:MAG: alpha-glucosidase C-terminal domain-containing protein, partial [Phycisphaerales bacterium]